jgi:hypothetical protein
MRPLQLRPEERAEMDELNQLRDQLAASEAARQLSDEYWGKLSELLKNGGMDDPAFVYGQVKATVAASEAARQQLLDTLTAARDLLVGCQKQAGYLPQQGGYATALTEAEMTLARGIASLDDILTGASR